MVEVTDGRRGKHTLGKARETDKEMKLQQIGRAYGPRMVPRNGAEDGNLVGMFSFMTFFTVRGF